MQSFSISKQVVYVVSPGLQSVKLHESYLKCSIRIARGGFLPLLPFYFRNHLSEIIKVKVMLILDIINYALRHEDVSVSGGKVPQFLVLPLEGNECSAPSPGHLTPGERASGIHFIGGLVGSRAGIDVMEHRNLNPMSGI
jgi:hypothetical protein